jgi:hypothetical protein
MGRAVGQIGRDLDPYPKNGLLSGMALTYVTAILAVILGLMIPTFAEMFTHPVSPALLQAFLVSIGLMILHKGESYWTKEYDRCPVYLASTRASWSKNPRQVLFVGFVGTFLILMLALYLAMKGPPWILLLLTIWLAQGLHEIHHSAKCLAERRYYPGTVSSIVFVAYVGLYVFPHWYDLVVAERGFYFHLYYYLYVPVFIAFYFEHRCWLKRVATPL